MSKVGNNIHIQIILLVLCFILSNNLLWGAGIPSDTLFLRPGKKSVHLKPYIRMVSSLKDLSSQEVLAIAKHQIHPYSKVKHDEFLWAFFTLRRSDSKQDFVLEINNPTLQHYELFRVDEQENWAKISEGGERYPFTQTTLYTHLLLIKVS